MAAFPATDLDQTLVDALPPTYNERRVALLNLARFAETSERFEDMCKIMKAVVQLDDFAIRTKIPEAVTLSVEERNLVSICRVILLLKPLANVYIVRYVCVHHQILLCLVLYSSLSVTRMSSPLVARHGALSKPLLMRRVVHPAILKFTLSNLRKSYASFPMKSFLY